MRGPRPGVPPRRRRLQGQVVRVRLPQLHGGGPLRRRRLPRGGALGDGGGASAHGAGGGGDTKAEVGVRINKGKLEFLEKKMIFDKLSEYEEGFQGDNFLVLDFGMKRLLCLSYGFKQYEEEYFYILMEYVSFFSLGPPGITGATPPPPLLKPIPPTVRLCQTRRTARSPWGWRWLPEWS